MKLFTFFLFCSIGVAISQPSQYLGVPPKERRAPLASLDRQHFLSKTNVQRIIVVPSTRWKVSGIGPDFDIERFKKAFQSSAPIVAPSEELESMIAWEEMSDAPHRSRIQWSGAYFLTGDGDFLTFGEIAEGFVLRTRDRVGVIVTKKAEPDGAANGSQPFSSDTNRTSSAAGSRR